MGVALGRQRRGVETAGRVMTRKRTRTLGRCTPRHTGTAQHMELLLERAGFWRELPSTEATVLVVRPQEYLPLQGGGLYCHPADP